MGADEIDMNYNEILSEYKESICRKSSEPPSPTKIKSTLSEGGSPLMGKQAIQIKKNLKLDMRNRMIQMSRQNNTGQSFLKLMDTPPEVVVYSKNYYLLQSLKVNRYFDMIPQLYNQLKGILGAEEDLDKLVQDLDIDIAYAYLDQENGRDDDCAYLPIQSPNLKMNHKKLFSLSTIKQIENEKVSQIIRKRLKQNKAILRKSKCLTLGHKHTLPNLEVFGLSSKKKRKDDSDVDYYDPVTHAINALAL